MYYIITQKYFLPNKNKQKKVIFGKKKQNYELTCTITVIVSYSIWNTVDFLLRKIISQVDFKQNIFSWQINKTFQIRQTKIGFAFKVLFI